MQQIWWFVKAKRAQNDSDFETWIEGEVTPTLNAFDLGDTRTTVLIIDGTRVGDVRVYEDQVMQTVIRRWGTGGGNVPYVFPIQDGREVEKKQNGLGVGEDGDPAYTIDTVSHQAVVMRDREGKPGGGEGTIGIGQSIHTRDIEFSHCFP